MNVFDVDILFLAKYAKVTQRIPTPTPLPRGEKNKE